MCIPRSSGSRLHLLRNALPLFVLLAFSSAGGADQGLVDFSKPPSASRGDFLNHAKQTNAALVIQAAKDWGRCIYPMNPPLDLSRFADCTPVLTVTVGVSNKATAICVQLQDTNGASYIFQFAFDKTAPGTPAILIAQGGCALKDPWLIDVASPELDLAHISEIHIRGSYTSKPLDATICRLELVQHSPAILSAKEKGKDDRNARIKNQTESRDLAAKFGWIKGIRQFEFIQPGILSVTLDGAITGTLSPNNIYPHAVREALGSEFDFDQPTAVYHRKRHGSGLQDSPASRGGGPFKRSLAQLPRFQALLLYAGRQSGLLVRLLPAPAPTAEIRQLLYREGCPAQG